MGSAERCRGINVILYIFYGQCTIEAFSDAREHCKINQMGIMPINANNKSLLIMIFLCETRTSFHLLVRVCKFAPEAVVEILP